MISSGEEYFYPSISIFSPDFISTVKWSSQTVICFSQRFTRVSSKESSRAGCNEVLQLIDAGNLCVSCSGVYRAFLPLFSESKDLIGNLVIGFFVMGLFEKFLLELLQFLVNTVSSVFLGAADDLCDILLEFDLVCRLISKEPVNRLNYHIFQYGLIDRSGMAF